jgi:SAM-dependent methyltransferase
MVNTFVTNETEHLLLPGTPGDYLDTVVLGDENRALLAEREVMLQILRDQTPLPTTEAREGYFGPRHMEYWLSGLRDMRKVIAATGLNEIAEPRVLDFGGASGRVARHFAAWQQSCEVFNCDINPNHILLCKRLFGSRVTSFHSRGLPALPFPDCYLDCVTAFSVLTHIDSEDTAWLLELRRIVKPGGHLYLTIHDQGTWNILPNTVIADLSFSNDDFRRFHGEHPRLIGRVVHTYSDATDYNCNVFLGIDYIERYWAPLFHGCSLSSLAHDHQTALILTV